MGRLLNLSRNKVGRTGPALGWKLTEPGSGLASVSRRRQQVVNGMSDSVMLAGQQDVVLVTRTRIEANGAGCDKGASAPFSMGATPITTQNGRY